MSGIRRWGHWQIAVQQANCYVLGSDSALGLRYEMKISRTYTYRTLTMCRDGGFAKGSLHIYYCSTYGTKGNIAAEIRAYQIRPRHARGTRGQYFTGMPHYMTLC
jgi:hypothetical protein